jgi:patatin-like phospholipase/acyl hydrolase
MSARRFRLLSIDGGGLRGLIPALVLAHIEEQTQKPVHELFDAVAGTSSGAILALGLVHPTPRSAVHLARLYREFAGTIFAETLADKVAPLSWLGFARGLDLNDLWRPRYSPKGRTTALEGLYGEARLREARLPVFIPSYDLEMRCPVVFVSRAEHENPDDTFYEATAQASFLDAVLASSAAPSYFPPHRVPRSAGGAYALVDGGIVANNPTSFAHGVFRGAESEGDIVLSLGTGSLQDPFPFDTAKKWGTLSWMSPLLKIVLDGQTEAVATVMRARLHGAHYVRVQGLLEGSGATDELDDLRPENLDALERFAVKLIETHRRELDLLCNALV